MLIHYQRLRAEISQSEIDVVRVPPGVDRHNHDARNGSSEIQFEILVRIQHPYGETVALLDPLSAKKRRFTIGEVVKLAPGKSPARRIRAIKLFSATKTKQNIHKNSSLCSPSRGARPGGAAPCAAIRTGVTQQSRSPIRKNHSSAVAVIKTFSNTEITAA